MIIEWQAIAEHLLGRRSVGTGRTPFGIEVVLALHGGHRQQQLAAKDQQEADNGGCREQSICYCHDDTNSAGDLNES
ncbi:MAG: hypothetical protein PsegKO_23920 [Pseudohongiellaceae bacterium]